VNNSDSHSDSHSDNHNGSASPDADADAATTDGAIPKKRNPILTGLIIVAVLAVALFAGKRIADNIIPDVPGVTLTDVHTIEDLRSRFNQDQGAPRLVLLVSPT